MNAPVDSDAQSSWSYGYMKDAKGMKWPRKKLVVLNIVGTYIQSNGRNRAESEIAYR